MIPQVVMTVPCIDETLDSLTLQELGRNIQNLCHIESAGCSAGV